jgi:hypothetical protein
MGSGSACGTMGSEGGGERGRRSGGIAADGCDVKGGPLGSCVKAGVRSRRVRGLGPPLLGWEERTADDEEDGGGGEGEDVTKACDGESSDKAGRGTVCFGSESVGGGDG